MNDIDKDIRCIEQFLQNEIFYLKIEKQKNKLIRNYSQNFQLKENKKKKI